MLKSNDNIIQITTAKDISDVVFQPADWSIVNIPIDTGKAKKMVNNLYNMPSHRHTTLVLNRHRRKDRVKGLAAFRAFDGSKWKFLDSVSLSYGKPSTCSNNGFLPLSEHGFLFHKGDAPDAKNTDWASDGEYRNATNDWILVPQPIEIKFFQDTYYQKVSWDLLKIMTTLCGVKETSRFIYDSVSSLLTEVEIRSMHAFCKLNNLTVELVVQDSKAANFVLNCLENNNAIIQEVEGK